MTSSEMEVARVWSVSRVALRCFSRLTTRTSRVLLEEIELALVGGADVCVVRRGVLRADSSWPIALSSLCRSFDALSISRC